MTQKELFGCILFFLLLVPGLAFVRQTSASNIPTAGGAEHRLKEVIFIPWGKGPGQAGKLERQEGASEGPASFALSPTEEFYLLDQVNARVLKFGPAGRLLSQIPLPAPHAEGALFQDIAVAPDGKLALLDNLVAQALVILDPGGMEIRRYNFSQFGIATRRGSQSVGSRMFISGDGLYLEDLTTNRWFRPLNNAFELVKFDRHLGLPYRGGKELLNINVKFDKGKKLYQVTLTSSEYTQLNQKEKKFFAPDFYHTVLFDHDSNNNIYFVYYYSKVSEKTGNPSESGYIGIKFDKDFQEIGRFKLVLRNEFPLDYVNNCKVTPEGKLYLMIYTPKGVQIFRWE